jgi:hypothetical protein
LLVVTAVLAGVAGVAAAADADAAVDVEVVAGDLLGHPRCRCLRW